MANVFDVAVYILQECGEIHVSELQEYLQYAQAWRFIWVKKSFFQENDVNSISSFLVEKTKNLYVTADVFSSVGNSSNLTAGEASDVDRVILFYKPNIKKNIYLGAQDSRVIFPVLNSAQSLIDQLNVDIEKVFTSHYEFLLTALSVLKLDHELTSNFHYQKLKVVSFSDSMRSVESSFSAFSRLSEFCGRIFVTADNPVIEAAILKIHNNLCASLNTALEDIVKKYEVVTKKFCDPTLVFLSHDCFSPASFSECSGVNETSLREFYRQALIVYGYTKPPITITFRDEAFGEGAFFDHYNIQKITNRKTEISLPKGWSAEVFYDAIKKRQLKLPCNTSENTFPAISSNDPDDLGLMIVPGYSSATLEKRPTIHQQRIAHEIAMIKQAQEHGWAVFAICGGLWTLVEAIGGSVKSVNHHRGAMPKLLENGEIDLGEKPNIHSLFVDPKTKIAKFMGLSQYSMQHFRLSALSVHWQAVDKLPVGFRASAFADQNMKEVEAIENTDNKSSIIGIQGHPEAMRKNHIKLSNATQKHHALINSLVKEGDESHQKRLDNKANEVGRYSSSELMQKFGIGQGSYLTQAEEKEARDRVLDGLEYVGLSLQRLSQSKASFLQAVAIYLEQDLQDLQESIAINLEKNSEKYLAIVELLLLPEQTYDDYVYQVRGSAWAEDIKIQDLMSLLNRAVIVIKSQGVIVHADKAECFTDDPIFVFYSGHGHYDGLLQHSNMPARKTLERLHWNHSAYHFST